MNRILFIASLLVVATFTLSGCSHNQTQPTPTVETPSAAQPATQQETTPESLEGELNGMMLEEETFQ